MNNSENIKIAVIGLGYVGLPLAVEFGKQFDVIGYDISKSRINELSNSIDSTLEVTKEEIAEANKLSFTQNKDHLRESKVFIVTVPTPIDEFNQPDFLPLIEASRLLGSVIKHNDIIIYESTVYPGATEEVCLPVVEKVSGLKLNQDFFAGLGLNQMMLLLELFFLHYLASHSIT